jgi:hypothetical protein
LLRVRSRVVGRVVFPPSLPRLAAVQPEQLVSRRTQVEKVVDQVAPVKLTEATRPGRQPATLWRPGRQQAAGEEPAESGNYLSEDGLHHPGQTSWANTLFGHNYL